MAEDGVPPLELGPITLPEPSGESARAGRALFGKWLDAQRRESFRPELENEANIEPENSQANIAMVEGREYPLAYAIVFGNPAASLAAPGVEVLEQSYVETEAQRAQDHNAALDLRPPPGAPSIRPSVQRVDFPSFDQEKLESAADGVMITSDSDGGMSFEIVFNEEVLENTLCRLYLKDGEIKASFVVGDNDQRRLLESESGMLRARLEDRGFKVSAIDVVLEESLP